MHDAFTCRHQIQTVEDLAVVVCTTCQTTEWWDSTRLLDATEGVARLFGEFELTGTLEGVGSPSPLVLTYRAPNAAARRSLRVFPINQWIRVHDGLWLSHDGSTLLLAPTDRSIVRSFAG